MVTIQTLCFGGGVFLRTSAPRQQGKKNVYIFWMAVEYVDRFKHVEMVGHGKWVWHFYSRPSPTNQYVDSVKTVDFHTFTKQHADSLKGVILI